jgi:hypothetical protein
VHKVGGGTWSGALAGTATLRLSWEGLVQCTRCSACMAPPPEAHMCTAQCCWRVAGSACTCTCMASCWREWCAAPAAMASIGLTAFTGHAEC